MEFIFDQNRSSAGTINNSPSIDDFKTNSPIRRAAIRKPVQSVEDIEISGTRSPRRRKSMSSNPPVKYSTKARRSKARSASQGFEMSWTKFGWMICGCLMLRLVFMDSGVIDFYKMEDSILRNEQSLVLVKEDNNALVNEIRKIRTSPKYQKKVTREHLGVISPNEYLVIFGTDS